jgi:hypothetical protein
VAVVAEVGHRAGPHVDHDQAVAVAHDAPAEPVDQVPTDGQVAARRPVHAHGAVGLSCGHHDGTVAAHQDDGARVPTVRELFEADFHLAHAGGRIGLARSEPEQAPTVDVALDAVAVVHLPLRSLAGFLRLE